MRIQCPQCSFSASIDARRIPAAGRGVTCPECGHRFLVRPEAVAADELDTLRGPAAVAVKKPGSRLWTVVPARELPAHGQPLGLMLSLAKSDGERSGDPATSAAVVTRGFPRLTATIPSWLTPVLLMLAALFGLAGYFWGQGLTVASNRTVLATPAELTLALLVALAAYVALSAAESAAIGGQVSGRAPLWGLRGGFLAMEPVTWRLGLPLDVAFTAIALAFALLLASFGWFLCAPAPLLGVMTGALFYLITALYPLEPGPGSKCLEALTGSVDIPKQLRWTLISRFMAVRSHAEAATGKAMALAALFLSLWVAGAGAAFYFLTSTLLTRGSIAGALWQSLFSLLGLGYALWLIVRLGLMVRDAARLTGGQQLAAATPSAAMVEEWKATSALIAHIPHLRHAAWQWATASAGCYLIRRGADDSRFYWLASGRAAVFARDRNGDPLHVTSLGAGSGVGEIALLEQVKRTADVVIEQTTVVAMLERDEFLNCTDADDHLLFRRVIMATQALARSQVFFGLPGADRERWIAGGRPVVCPAGEVIVREESDDKWIGLIVSGTVEVKKGETTVATLAADNVIGEMAYLSGSRRSATLKAADEVVLWVWAAEWLDSRLEESGLRANLLQLARLRGGP